MDDRLREAATEAVRRMDGLDRMLDQFDSPPPLNPFYELMADLEFIAYHGGVVLPDLRLAVRVVRHLERQKEKAHV